MPLTSLDFGLAQLQALEDEPIAIAVGTDGDDLIADGTKATTAGELGNNTIFGTDSDDILRGDRDSCSSGGCNDKLFV